MIFQFPDNTTNTGQIDWMEVALHRSLKALTHVAKQHVRIQFDSQLLIAFSKALATTQRQH